MRKKKAMTGKEYIFLGKRAQGFTYLTRFCAEGRKERKGEKMTKKGNMLFVEKGL